MSPRSSREKRRRYPQEASPSSADMTQQHQARRQTEPAGEQVADPRYPQDRAEVAAPVELRGSRTRVGRYRRRRRGTPNADDNLACVGMNQVVGWRRCQGFLRGLIPLTMEGVNR